MEKREDPGPVIVVMMGEPCQEKTTLSRLLAKDLQSTLIDIESIRICTKRTVLQSKESSLASSQFIQDLSNELVILLCSTQLHCGLNIVINWPPSDLDPLLHFSALKGCRLAIVDCKTHPQPQDDGGESTQFRYNSQHFPKLVVDTESFLSEQVSAVLQFIDSVAPTVSSGTTTPKTPTNDIQEEKAKAEETDEICLQIQSCPLDHPLILSDNYDAYKYQCLRCFESIVGEMYSCTACKLFLHKSCANLKKKEKFRFHEHDVCLQLSLPIDSKQLYCNVCEIQIVNGSYYSCPHCVFHLHSKCCTPFGSMTSSAGHQHSLSQSLLINRGYVRFECKACGRLSTGVTALYCGSCGLYFHSKCALSLASVEHKCHEHPLILTASHCGGGNSTSGENTCDICKTQRNPKHWVYACQQCNFVAHMSCVTPYKFFDIESGCTAYRPELEDILHGTAGTAKVEEAKWKGETKGRNPKRCTHDDHLLIYSDGQHEEEEEPSICNGCLELISGPSYTCKDCLFCLHKSCASLPSQMDIELKYLYGRKQTLHLELVSPNTFPQQNCDICRGNLQGFCYSSDDYSLHPWCCSLPKGIKHHPCHNHSLYLHKKVDQFYCGACGYYDEVWWDRARYICGECGLEFHVSCVFSPPVSAEKCASNHYLKLTCHPGGENDDGSQPYFCDKCEDERYPDQWVYFCDTCDFVAHLECGSPAIRAMISQKCKKIYRERRMCSFSN